MVWGRGLFVRKDAGLPPGHVRRSTSCSIGSHQSDELIRYLGFSLHGSVGLVGHLRVSPKASDSANGTISYYRGNAWRGCPAHDSRGDLRLVKSYGLQQEFITPYTPEQNGMVERVIRTLKDQCVHRHRFESLQHASRVIGDWIGFYNNQRPHQALDMRTPAEVYALAA